MGMLDGKVALVTGAARGQGRSHAVRLAQEGADVIAVDICRQIETVQYPLATSEDLAETVARIEALDRRVVASETDVRDHEALATAVGDGISRLGGIDIVVANAGIGAVGGRLGEGEAQKFRDTVEVNLFGVWNTVQAAAPTMIEQGRGGSIVLTSSTQGLTGRGGNGSGGMDGYCASKHGVVGLMRTFTHWLAPHSIRVNSVHPTGVDTPMIDNPAVQQYLTDFPAVAEALSNLLPVPLVEAGDVSNAVLWLVSEQARYVTGVTLPVDGGFVAK